MNLGDRTKGKYVPPRRIPASAQKFELEDSMESSSRRKPRLRREVADYDDPMEKQYSPAMAERSPVYTPADVYKARKHRALTGKSTNMYGQAMSNDDLYRMIHNSSGTQAKSSVDSLVARKDGRRQRIGQGALSLIADEDEEEEVSEPEYTCEPRPKAFEDDEADDEIDYESDQYGVDRLDQVKDYRRFSQKSVEPDTLKQQYEEWLEQRRSQSLREMDKAQALKYERRGKSSLKPVEEPPEHRKHVGMHKCSECGTYRLKTLDSQVKPGLRGGRMMYDYPEFPRDFSGKCSKFQDPREEIPCPKPRKSKNISRHREQKKTISHSPSKIDTYYDE
ncbi:uncharacterized protein LOC107038935 [Diachasma alloeum]|uniref:uncharacterized protein LOC107038935 n=1 Tax=Diachasma alloeum TaxID=454923 RepID=UPI0007382D8B|nr:uncharacterized protein LOC107038935 [Diachasma alloeum]